MTRQLLTPRATPGARGRQTAWLSSSQGGAHESTLPQPSTGRSHATGRERKRPPQKSDRAAQGTPSRPPDTQGNPAVGGARAWAFKQPPAAAGDMQHGHRRGATGNPCATRPPPRSPRTARGPLRDVSPVPPRQARGDPPPLPSPPRGPRRPGRSATGSTRRAPADCHPPAFTVTSASCGASRPANLPASRLPVRRGAPWTAPGRGRTDKNQSSMETTPSMD